MSIIEKKHRRLPKGWRLFVNLAYVSPYEEEARRFAETVISEYQQTFDFTSVGSTQVVYLVIMPSDKVLRRTLELASDYGFKFVLLNAEPACGGYRTGSIEVTPIIGGPVRRPIA